MVPVQLFSELPATMVPSRVTVAPRLSTPSELSAMVEKETVTVPAPAASPAPTPLGAWPAHGGESNPPCPVVLPDRVVSTMVSAADEYTAPPSPPTPGLLQPGSTGMALPPVPLVSELKVSALRVTDPAEE